MKIVIPVLGFGAAGGVRVLGKLADSFSEMGHDVFILAPKGREVPYYPIKSRIVSFYWPFSNVPLLRHISLILSLLLKLIVLRKSIDRFVANANLTAFPVFLATIFGSKGVYYIQAYEPEFFDEKKGLLAEIGKKIAKLSYSLPLLRIVNADIYKNYHEIKANYVVEPGIDLEIFHPRSKQHELEPTVIIGCIGRKELWKGTRHIIDAVLAVRNEYGLDVKLKVAFNLPIELDDEYKSFVELVQPHGDENLADFYRSCDIFCATGLIQNGAFHYPCMEAMASGLLVISNYSPLDERTGFILDVVTVESIKVQLVKALKMNAAEIKEMKILAIEKVKLYSWPMVSKKMASIFENAV